MDASVIIVGGGPVGLSLALGLHARGIRSIVLEKRPTPEQNAGAFALWPRTLEHLERCGAAEALRRASLFQHAIAAIDAATSKPLLALDFDVLTDLLERPGVALLAQSRIECVLRELVEVAASCELRAGCEAIAIDQDATGVIVRTRDADGAERSLRAAYAVGCDGRDSVVRKTLGLPLERLAYGVRVVISDEDVEPQRDSATVRLAMGAPAALFAVRYGERQWRVVACVPPGMDDATALGQAAHQQRLQAAFDGSGNSARTLWKAVVTLERQRASRLVCGRVALAGDAAHALSPIGGEGANVGIADAANLAWKLAYAVESRGDAGILLASYEAERRQAVADSAERTSDTLAKFVARTPVWMRRVAVSYMRRFLRGRGMQRKTARGVGMLTARYAKSPIVDARHPLAGKRLDNLVLPGGQRLHHRLDGEAGLVAVALPAFEEPAIHLERAPKRWCVKPPAVLIVRPDCVVAAVVEKPTRAKVHAAWNRAFAITSVTLSLSKGATDRCNEGTHPSTGSG